jgi:hypothetical protein
VTYRVLAIYPTLRPAMALARFDSSSCATSKEFTTTKGIPGRSKKMISPERRLVPLFYYVMMTIRSLPYSFCHPLKTYHQLSFGNCRRLPIRGSFGGPGGYMRFSLGAENALLHAYKTDAAARPTPANST